MVFEGVGLGVGLLVVVDGVGSIVATGVAEPHPTQMHCFLKFPGLSISEL